MRIKLYTWTELHKMHNREIDGEYAYCIPKKIYQRLAKRTRRAIKDSNISYFVKYRGTRGFFIPYSFVKEIIHED